jgi:hypothetical protein
MIHREVTQHSFIQDRQKRLILSAVKRELTEVVKLDSWFLLDTTDLYREMRIWVKRWKSREKWYIERWPSTASYRIDRKD